MCILTLSFVYTLYLHKRRMNMSRSIELVVLTKSNHVFNELRVQQVRKYWSAVPDYKPINLCFYYIAASYA